MLKNINKKIHLFWGIILILISIFLFIIFLPVKIEALGILPFGGRITATFPGCVNGLMVTVGPPRGGNFMFTAGSQLYSYYQIYRPGPWVLGNYAPGGACVVCTPGGCYPIPTIGTIIKVGTSLK